MTRIGKKPITIPEKVEVKIENGSVSFHGPLGTYRQSLPGIFLVVLEGRTLKVSSTGSSRKERALWGLYRSLLDGAVQGVTQGYRQELELSGIGLKAKKEGRDLVFSLGFSHPVKFAAPEGIEFEIKDENKVSVIGIDKGLVGRTAARIHRLKPPEPYKGKGIRYRGEVVRRKAGKVGKVGAALGAK